MQLRQIQKKAFAKKLTAGPECLALFFVAPNADHEGSMEGL